MKEYLLAIAGVVLLSATLTAILPEGKTSGLIKSVMRMACILAIISPILSFFSPKGGMDGILENSYSFFTQTGIDTEDAFIHYHSEIRIKETEKALEKEILSRFSVESQVEVGWELQSELVQGNNAMEVIKITQIYVKMSEYKEAVAEKMWEYLTKNYCSEVLIE